MTGITLTWLKDSQRAECLTDLGNLHCVPIHVEKGGSGMFASANNKMFVAAMLGKRPKKKKIKRERKPLNNKKIVMAKKMETANKRSILHTL